VVVRIGGLAGKEQGRTPDRLYLVSNAISGPHVLGLLESYKFQVVGLRCEENLCAYIVRGREGMSQLKN